MLLDTTVLVYAVGENHPLASAARSLVQQISSGALRAQTTPEVIQEFAHVRARRRSRMNAYELSGAFSTLLSPLQLVGPGHLQAGLELWTRTASLGAFDAVLAAVALSLDAELVSADRAFADVPDLRWRPLQELG